MVKKIKYKIANIELSKIVSLLGKILGIVVKEQEGTVLYNKIEEIRSLSKASRGTKNKKKIKLNETKKFRQLISTINKLKPKESLVIARSFSKFLNFSNLAESLDSVHKIDEGNIQKAQGTNAFTILEDAIDRLLKQKSISKEKFYQVAKTLKVNLVLTAHPTEVKRRTLIQKYTNVNNILEKFEQDDETEAVLMIGEIGGPQEVAAGKFVKENMKKPVIAYIAGLTAPKGRVMGHAGAIVSAYGESAVEKVELLKECGVAISKNPSVMGETVKLTLNGKKN